MLYYEVILIWVPKLLICLTADFVTNNLFVVLDIIDNHLINSASMLSLLQILSLLCDNKILLVNACDGDEIIQQPAGKHLQQ